MRTEGKGEEEVVEEEEEEEDKNDLSEKCRGCAWIQWRNYDKAFLIAAH